MLNITFCSGNFSNGVPNALQFRNFSISYVYFLFALMFFIFVKIQYLENQYYFWNISGLMSTVTYLDTSSS